MVTDGHDQFTRAIAAFKDTAHKYGQPWVDLLFTDKPGDDKAYFSGILPGLRATQERLDQMAPPPAADENMLPTCTIDESRCQVLKTAAEINTKVDAMRNQVAALPAHLRTISIDAEWDIHKNAQGFIVRTGTVAIIQLGYCLEEGGAANALILKVHGMKKLPDRLLGLLADKNITFTGRAIGADFKRIGRDFNCMAKVLQVRNQHRQIDLGVMARKRDVVQSGVVTLDRLVAVVLEERLPKDPLVRCSNQWSAKVLSAEQVMYAALDVIKPLEVYFKLTLKPDLTMRLKAAEATVGVVADVVPSHGSVAILATRAAVVMIEEPAAWTTPHGCKPPMLNETAARRRVLVTEVLAPSLVVPGVKKHSKPMCLGDFGPPPFLMMLPLNMLKVHVNGDVRVTPASEMDPVVIDPNLKCKVCKLPDDAPQMLICDCGAGYHTYCLSPPLTDVPAGKCDYQALVCSVPSSLDN